jgi:serine protease Do
LPHDTPLRPKDCGGPLVDTDGRVAGINIARALRVATYALPARDVRQVLNELRRKSQSTVKD